MEELLIKAIEANQETALICFTVIIVVLIWAFVKLFKD